MHPRPRPALPQAHQRRPRHPSLLHGELCQLAKAGIGSQQQMAPARQDHEKAHEARGQQRRRHPDGQHPRPDDLSPGEQRQADERPLSRLPQDAEQRRLDTAGRRVQDAERLAALPDSGQSSCLCVSTFFTCGQVWANRYLLKKIKIPHMFIQFI